MIWLRNLPRYVVALAMVLPPLVGLAFAQATKSETRFEDWVVACDDSSGEKKCSLSQTFTKAGTGKVVLAFIVTKDAEGKFKAVVFAPTQVLLAPGLTVTVEGVDPVNASYTYCSPQACVAEFPFTDAWVEAFRKLTSFSVSFEPVGQKPAAVNGSLKGFMAALEFFDKQ